MPTINVNDAYILDETGAEVDKATGLFTKNENATTGEKQMARLNIAAGGSNPNLLDNAYFVGGGSQLGDGVFPINQRGQSSYTGGGTQLDRWKTWEANDVITLTANGVKFKSPNGNGMFQYWSEFPTTKTVTFSAIIDGNIYSVTLPEGDTQYEYIGTGFKIGISRNGKCVYIKSQNTEILIAACKLEVGTVSTLANDPPPDFGEELAKCKRRLRYVPLKRTPVILDGGYSVAVVTLTGIEMASSPTASLITAGTAYAYNPLTSATPTSASVIAFDYNTPTIQLGLNAALNGIGVVYDTVIQLSCEL